jgi:hypothetical protein
VRTVQLASLPSFLLVTALLATFAAHAVAAITPYKVTLLHPMPGYSGSAASGVSGGKQSGYAFGSATGDFIHAAVWSGSSGSFVDLNPIGITNSSIAGMDGTTYVGSGTGTATGFVGHAVMWPSTAPTIVDLHPAGFVSSGAEDVDGNSQVGVAYVGNSPSSDARAVL